MNTIEFRILRMLQTEPRSARFFCGFDNFGYVLTFKVISEKFEKMAAAGYVQRLNNGRYRITPAGLDFLKYRGMMPGLRAAPPVFNNLSTTAAYVPPAWGAARPGANDFLALRSRGF
jgi:hypothetical protein